MDKKQLKQKLIELNNKYINDVNSIKLKYAHANSKFIKGDIVTDGEGFFEIISPYYDDGSISYVANVLTKKLKPRKDKQRRHCYESRLTAV